MLFSSFVSVAFASIAVASVLPRDASTTTSSTTATPTTNATTCNGKTYIYEEMAGYGFILNNSVDAYKDTLGGMGSAIALDSSTWKWDGTCYTGTVYMLPDRGWNTEGTLNYQNRIHQFQLAFTPNETATVSNPSGPNLQFTYQKTILLTDPEGTPTSGLDAGINGPYLNFSGSVGEVPSVNYTGDGFGGSGSGGVHVAIDTEGLVLGSNGTFWVSDEYGDYIYQFSAEGTMLRAIRPPPAFLPVRNATVSFSSDNPPAYNSALAPTPTDPVTGRANNQGLEGLTINPSGTKLYALAQSALMQDGGSKNKNSRYARFLEYDISVSPTKLVNEYVVGLNHVTPGDSDSKTARQSEIHYISDTQFLVLAHDSNEGRGQGQGNTESIYRDVDIFDISNATNVAGLSDCETCAVASSKGNLNSNTTAATYCRWLDYNVNSQLNRFGVHNGGSDYNTPALLNEKWESIALVPVNTTSDGRAVNDEYYLLTLSDNDFITQDGHQNFGNFNYSDSSGFNLDTQALMFKVKLPAGASPLIG